MAGETTKISHQHLQPDGALPPPSGGQQGEESHACRGARAGCGEVGSHVHEPGRWVFLQPAIPGNPQGPGPLRPSKPSVLNLCCLPFVSSTFGELKTVRLPKKMTGTGAHRGFGFVDFITKQDAKVSTAPREAQSPWAGQSVTTSCLRLSP